MHLLGPRASSSSRSMTAAAARPAAASMSRSPAPVPHRRQQPAWTRHSGGASVPSPARPSCRPSSSSSRRARMRSRPDAGWQRHLLRPHRRLCPSLQHRQGPRRRPWHRRQRRFRPPLLLPQSRHRSRRKSPQRRQRRQPRRWPVPSLPVPGRAATAPASRTARTARSSCGSRPAASPWGATAATAASGRRAR